MKIERVCKFCTGVFLTFPCRVKVGGGVYCSSKCSNSAKVRSSESDSFWARVDRQGGKDSCWPWTGAFYPNGYGHFTKIGGGSVGAHRYAYKTTKGEIPPGKMILHSCDVRSCCNPDHLRVGSHQENMTDMVERKRHRVVKSVGSDNGRSKLTADQIASILKKHQSGETKLSLAVEFGVTRQHIGHIINKKSWKHS